MSSAAAPATAPAPTDERLPLGLRPDGTMTRPAAAIGFVLGIICVFGALPLAIVGIVLSSMGMNRVQSDRALARKLVAWSWGVLGVTSALVLLVVAAVVVSRAG